MNKLQLYRDLLESLDEALYFNQVDKAELLRDLIEELHAGTTT